MASQPVILEYTLADGRRRVHVVSKERAERVLKEFPAIAFRLIAVDPELMHEV